MAKPTDITLLLDERNNPPKRYASDALGRALHGRCVAYRQDGALLLEITYDHGVADGAYRDYGSDGRLACEGQYSCGVQEGEWRFYHRPDESPEVIRFVNGREVVDWNSFFGREGSDA
jgi:antitoxin component YwqK of YwqJK toxin-antitoxin module